MFDRGNFIANAGGNKYGGCTAFTEALIVLTMPLYAVFATISALEISRHVFTCT